ncbi:peptidoglycan editing factor PgeF [Patescibacteria group bacterium]|nr:peptidoglycan editing factor PgeF [Patescibacteria group bacterium]
MITIHLSPDAYSVVTETSEGNIDARFGKKSLIQSNIKNIAKQLKINPLDFVQMRQVHKTHIARVGKAHRGTKIKEVDGLITDEPDAVLMLRVADCIPVFLLDPQTRAIGLVHSGWRGSIGKIILVAIEKMMLEFNTNPRDLHIALGPSIQACCNRWERPPLQLELPEWEPFVTKKGNGFAVDLPAFVVDTSIKAGVKRENITMSKNCTVMDRKFFSHRRSQETGEAEGRFATIIGLKS